MQKFRCSQIRSRKKAFSNPFWSKNWKTDKSSSYLVSADSSVTKNWKLETIPAWFTTGDPEELALVENLVREDFSYGNCGGSKKLADRFGLKTNDDIGKVIGKAPSTVSEILSLNDLSENIRNKIRGDKKSPYVN